MKQLELFNHWMNRITSKYLSHKPPTTGYKAVFDVKEVIEGKVKNGLFKPTQQDKPSPSSQYSYNDFIRIMNWTYLKKNKITRSYVGHTNSMEPTLDYGDMLLKTSYEEYKKKNGGLKIGDIAIFDFGGTRIVHRHVGKTPEGLYIFKGDNNFLADSPVREEQIQDVVVGILYTNDKTKNKQD